MRGVSGAYSCCICCKHALTKVPEARAARGDARSAAQRPLPCPRLIRAVASHTCAGAACCARREASSGAWAARSERTHCALLSGATRPLRPPAAAAPLALRAPLPRHPRPANDPDHTWDGCAPEGAPALLTNPLRARSRKRSRARRITVYAASQKVRGRLACFFCKFPGGKSGGALSARQCGGRRAVHLLHTPRKCRPSAGPVAAFRAPLPLPFRLTALQQLVTARRRAIRPAGGRGQGRPVAQQCCYRKPSAPRSR